MILIDVVALEHTVATKCSSIAARGVMPVTRTIPHLFMCMRTRCGRAVQALDAADPTGGALAKCAEKTVQQVTDITLLVRGKLSKLARKTLSALVRGTPHPCPPDPPPVHSRSPTSPPQVMLTSSFSCPWTHVLPCLLIPALLLLV